MLQGLVDYRNAAVQAAAKVREDAAGDMITNFLKNRKRLVDV